MGTKLTPKILERVRALHAASHSSRDIAATLTRELGKPVSRASVSSWLASNPAPPPAAKKPKAKASAPTPVPTPVPTAAPTPADEPALTPEAMYAALGAMLQHQQRESQRLAAEGDHVGAQKAVRLVVQLGGILSRQTKDEDEDDHVKVKVEEMGAAADRAVRALHSVVDAVRAERATWPKCPTCQQPRGELAGGDASTLRALVERFFKGGP